MIIKQIIIFLLMTFFLTGCVENNTEVESDFETIVDNNETAFSDATVILTTNSTTITLNEDRVEIDVTVIDRLNNPYEGGNVKIIYPNDVRDGRDIGVFTNSVVMVENGHAKFTYTAPKNISENTTDIVLGFYHDSDISAVKQYTIKLNPEQNQIVLTSYKLQDSY
ncbi:MAG: hypothetical protein U9P72_06895 [Campylobacterota bacterium]|nr:hypothetical protein [Campylobacterota bacterium]